MRQLSALQPYLNRIEDIGRGVDELQRLLGLAERQWKTRALIRQLTQPFPFAVAPPEYAQSEFPQVGSPFPPSGLINAGPVSPGLRRVRIQ